MNIIAWFAENIKIASGPDKFIGLPGVILKLKVYSDENVIMSYEATNLIMKENTKIKTVSNKLKNDTNI